MMNSIPKISQSSVPEPAEAQSTPAASTTAANSPEDDGEIVTLSAAATNATKFLDDARNADGIDHAAVAQIRNALQTGTYNVSPEDLARAIAKILQSTP